MPLTADPVRPRLRSGIEPRLTDDDALYLLCDRTGTDLVLDEGGAWAAAVLELCDGTRSLDALRASLALRDLDDDPDRVTDAVAVLTSAGVLEDAVATGLPAGVCERFDRQLAYFGQTLDPAAVAEAQRRLGAATVAIIGLGGLGSWCAYALACTGVGHLVGIDGDRVELSNLNRQVLYTPADVGKPKATVAARRLAEFAPEARVTAVPHRLESPEAVAAAIAGADLVVDAADWPPHEMDRWVNAACWEAGIPYLAMSQAPPLIRVGPLYVPGTTGCYACQEVRWRADYPAYDAIANATQPFAPATTFGPACGAVGALAASEAVHHLAGIGTPRTLGTALLVDTLAFTVEAEAVERVAGCPTCA